MTDDGPFHEGEFAVQDDVGERPLCRNLTTHPAIGLQMTEATKLQFDLEDALGATGGTHRFWALRVERWRQWMPPVKMDWEYLDASPFNP
jgi:hypothetical protein